METGLDQFQGGGDVDTVPNRARNRAILGVEFMSPVNLIFFFGVGFEIVSDMNSLDDQHIAILFNLACRFTMQPAFICRDPARYQRATEGAGQSSCGGGNQHVERGLVWFVELVVDSIMFGDLGMHTEVSWFFFRGDIGSPERTPDPFNLHVRGINNFISHNASCIHNEIEQLFPPSSDNIYFYAPKLSIPIKKFPMNLVWQISIE